MTSHQDTVLIVDLILHVRRTSDVVPNRKNNPNEVELLTYIHCDDI